MKLRKSILGVALLVAAPSVFAQQFRVGAPSVHLISGMGSRCLGVEGANRNSGTRLILWDCLEQPDQLFSLLPNGQIGTFSSNSMCVDDKGGLYHEMDQVQIWPCSQSSSRWRYTNGRITSPNGLCVDLRGGQWRPYLGNQDLILYHCTGGTNQRFIAGMTIHRGPRANVVNPGMQFPVIASSGSTTLNFVGGAIVAQGGGNIVAQGGGNIVAQGGGNIVAQGGGNIVAQGGGNIVAQGGGNVIVPVGDTFIPNQ